MAQHVKDVVEEMNELKNLVLGYDGGYPPTSIPALKVILTLIELVVKETKDLLRLGRFEVEKHPLPMVPNFSWEPQPAMMIPYIIEMIDVFVLDFDMMKIRVNSEGPGFVFFRYYLDRFRSRTVESIGDLVCKELTAQKAQEVHVKVWSAKKLTVDGRL